MSWYLGKGRVIGPVAGPLRQVDVAARGIEGGPDGLEVVGSVDQRDPAAAPAVIEPRPGGATQRAEGPRSDQVLPVRGPVRRGVQVAVATRDLSGVRSVGGQHPQVLSPAPVRDEGDLRAVRAVARLALEGGAGHEGGGGAALDGEGVEVAEQVEDEGGAVGADVDGDPRAAVGAEVDLAGGFEGEGLGGEGVVRGVRFLGVGGYNEEYVGSKGRDGRGPR